MERLRFLRLSLPSPTRTAAVLGAVGSLCGCSHWVEDRVSEHLSAPASTADDAAWFTGYFAPVYQAAPVGHMVLQDGSTLTWRSLQPFTTGLGLSCELPPIEPGAHRRSAVFETRAIASAVPRRSGTVVLLHGWGGSKELMVPLGLNLAGQGYRVFIPDARGHGERGGLPRFGADEAQDLVAWLDALAEREAWPAPLLVIGQSMGAVTGASLASLDARVKALVLVAPMPPWQAAVQAVFKWQQPWLAPWVPDEAVAVGASRALARRGVADLALSLPAILDGTQTPRPVLVVQGDADRISTVAYGWSLTNRAGPRAEHVVLAGRDHASFACHDAPLMQAVQPFLARHSEPP